MPDQSPEFPSDFLFETQPILLPNQRAITLLAQSASETPNTWVYINAPTGTGKSTMMVELGYLAALRNLQKNKGKIKVRFVVPSPELASLYEKKFAKKLAEGDKRV
jgi:replicative superfamily II helicase